ncbi:Gfo/Idh/MocA family protein [Actinomyces vulturis]|uniref:Gfo/Idh/MocA family protein n=1 Tax=Actinomyces vulturis TaxID=1857645 RepID=UPI000ACDCA07|nr:Gfo/Idh/MocA family oxidoreductase [Actinomyces vulturis]
MPVNIACIGGGLRFEALSDVIRLMPDRFRVVAVCEPDAHRSALAAQRWPEARIVSDVEALLPADEIDAALVLTPDFSHSSVATTLLRHRISVFIDKPLATSIKEADEILRASLSSGALVYVGHNMRFMPVIEEMKKLIDSGAIGRPLTFWIRHFIGRGGDYFFKDWHACNTLTGGLLIHKASHDLDALAYMTGAQFTAVSAIASRQVYHQCERRDPSLPQPPIVQSVDHWPPRSQRDIHPYADAYDSAIMSLQCVGGMIGTYMQCHFTPDYWRNFCIIGDAGRIENFGDSSGNGDIRVWNQRRAGYDAQPDVVVPLGTDPLDGRTHDGADQRMLEDFYLSLTTHQQPRTNVMDARMCIAAGELALKSIDTGGHYDLAYPPELKQ